MRASISSDCHSINVACAHSHVHVSRLRFACGVRAHCPFKSSFPLSTVWLLRIVRFDFYRITLVDSDDGVERETLSFDRQ